jgi:hypothetical protein
MSGYFRHWEITPICADFPVERKGFELMAIVASRLRVAGLAENLKSSDGHGGANYGALFARMSQIPLAFVPMQSNGRDVLMGAWALASYPADV